MNHPAVPEIDVHEAHRRSTTGAAHLLDVREVDEWALGRAPSAQHLAMSVLQVDAVPTDAPLLLICHLGGRSAMVAGHLAAAGFDVTNVRGGMDAWEAAGLPLTIEPHPR